MDRLYNFSAGPSCLPIEVLTEIQNNLLNYKNLGYSVLEMTHRSDAYYEINNTAIANLKQLMNLGDDYDVLFLTGGASSQFFMIPLNLANKDDIAYYALSGIFANKAYEEAKRFINANIISSSKDDNYNHIAKIDKTQIDKNAKYVHITLNNTIVGTAYNVLPDVGDTTLVGDMSSNILAKYYDFNKFGLIYAGAQKNIGVAGVTIVVIKKSLFNNINSDKLPLMIDYKTHSESCSLYNTPPVFAVYVVMLMTKWVIDRGGIKAMEDLNNKKANILYDIIDNSNLYYGTVVNKSDRSSMNVTFVLRNDELTNKFILEAKNYGLVNLKGHKAAGGIRASIYNSMPLEGVLKLADFMNKFENDNK